MLYLKFESFVLADPLMSIVYLFFKTNIIGMTPLGIFILFFFTTLFFFPPFPSEVAFFTCISLNANIFFLVILATIASVLGQIANYGLGFFFKKGFSKNKGDSHKKWGGLINKFGSVFLFFANIIFFPSEILSMIYGVSKFPFKKFVIITLIARAIKYIALALLFVYAKDLITGLFHF
jgi:membrane protein YqaA with SNARE-associated domain